MNLLSPIWPLYVSSLGASPSQLGYIIAVSNAIAAILQIPSGLLSDRYGRKMLNAIGTFLGIFPPLLYTLARTWTDLIPWVVLNGVATGLYLPIRWSFVADYSTPGRRAVAYSWMNIAFLLGSTVAPFAGGLVADAFGVLAPFPVCFAIMCACFGFSLLLQEPKKTRSQRPLATGSAVKTQGFLQIAIIFSALSVIQLAGIGMYSPITPEFMERQFTADYTAIGILYAVGFGMSSMIVQIPGGRLTAKRSRKKTILLATVLSSPFFGLFALSRSFFEAVLLMFLSNVILNVSWPAYQDLMMELTPSAHWGFMNGLSATSSFAGMMVGSAISGVLWEGFGMFFPYYVSAVMVLLSAVPLIFLKETTDRRER